MTLLPPGSPEFSAQFTRFRHSAFRLETLAAYGGSGEYDSLQAFLAGHAPQPHQGKLDWMALVRAAVRSGRTMRRVHVVTEPLSDYLRFEIGWSYAYNVAAGEDVRIIPVAPGESWPSNLPQEDFWLFDATTLFRLRYGADGGWLGVEHVPDPAMVAQARSVQDTALHVGTPWGEFVAERPELARQVPATPAP